MMMATIEIKTIEEQRHHWRLYGVRASGIQITWNSRSEFRISDRRLQANPPSLPHRLPSLNNRGQRRNSGQARGRIGNRSLFEQNDGAAETGECRALPSAVCRGFHSHVGGHVE
jgi:hypothetical protein